MQLMQVSLRYRQPSPVIFKVSTVKTHDGKNKDEKGCEFNEHSSCLNQMSMPKNNGDSYAPHRRRPCHEFGSIYPAANVIYKNK